MDAGQGNHPGEEVLQPIPKEHFEKIFEGSKMSANMRKAVASVLVPDYDENGLPLRKANGELLLGVNEAAAQYSLATASISRAVRDVHRKWLRYQVDNSLIPLFGAASPAYSQSTWAYQSEILAARSNGKPRRKKKIPWWKNNS